MSKLNIIVKHLSGSHAYGTNIEGSDVDYRGIFIADPISIRTPFFIVKEVEDQQEEDTKYFELTHYLKLLVNCNPNIQESLWVDESDITFQSDLYKKLRAEREKLISSKVAFTYSGYAFAQLKRIKGHNKWINNPQPEKPPHPKDFLSMVHNFTENRLYKVNLEDFKNDHRLVPYTENIFGLYKEPGYQTFSETTLNTTYEGDTHLLGPPMFIIKFNAGVYDEAKVRHEQYWEWKNKRNVTRSKLEEQFGYDTKHSMHLVRLLRSGKEVLETGKLLVKRPDAQELLEIRNGKLTYEELIKYAEDMDVEIKRLYQITKLRKSVDRNFAAKLLIELQDLAWSQK